MAGLLTHRRLGASAEYVRERLGTSLPAANRATARRVGAVERSMVQRMRQPRGLLLYNGTGKPTPVPFSPDGYIQVHSTDDSVDIERGPMTRAYALDLRSAGGCDCCPEDISWNLNLTSTQDPDPMCLTGSITWIAATCTWGLTLNVDYECWCTYCNSAFPG